MMDGAFSKLTHWQNLAIPLFARMLGRMFTLKQIRETLISKGMTRIREGSEVATADSVLIYWT